MVLGLNFINFALVCLCIFLIILSFKWIEVVCGLLLIAAGFFGLIGIIGGK